jgi:hypothetical protein
MREVARRQKNVGATVKAKTRKKRQRIRKKRRRHVKRIKSEW